MIAPLLAVLTFFSVLFFPAPLSILLALVAAYFDPLVPLAAGVFVDTLYYPGSGWPLYALCGLAITLIMYVLRTRYAMR